MEKETIELLEILKDTDISIYAFAEYFKKVGVKSRKEEVEAAKDLISRLAFIGNFEEFAECLIENETTGKPDWLYDIAMDNIDMLVEHLETEYSVVDNCIYEK